MGYLFFQTLIWLILAFLLGLALGWLLRGILCRGDDVSNRDAVETPVTPTAAASSAAAFTEPEPEITISSDMQPAVLSAPNGEPDDLKRIKGVGPVIQETLNKLGIFHFQQVADFTADNVAWVDDHISFPGRIEREQWVKQAADLASGVKTEFSERYDRGEVGEENPND